MRLGEWLETWLSLYVEPARLAANTKACYHRSVAAIPPYLAKAELSTLTAFDLQTWLLSVTRKYPRAAQLDRVMLSRALKLASKAHLCDPACVDTDLLPKPSHTPKEALILHDAEITAYIAAAADSPCAPLLLLCICCGLRRGEALGVRWEDYDGHCLQIKRQRMRVQHAYRPMPLKSAHARRNLLLPDPVRASLDRWPRSLSGWVCDTTPEKLQAAHRRVLSSAHLPAVTLHGLRHSFATLAAEVGMPMKLLQLAMGHSKMQLTADLYADHLPTLSDLPALTYQRFAAR